MADCFRLVYPPPCCASPDCPPPECWSCCPPGPLPDFDDCICFPDCICPPPICPVPRKCPSPAVKEAKEEPPPEEKAEEQKDESVECPPDADPEAERPTGYIEMNSGMESWLDYGFKIVCTSPVVPMKSEIRVGVPIYLMVCLEAVACIKLNPNCLSCWCWTNIFTDCNKCGIFKELYMGYSPCDTEYGQNIHRFVFRGSITPTSIDHTALTFNVKWLEKNLMLWFDDLKGNKKEKC